MTLKNRIKKNAFLYGLVFPAVFIKRMFSRYRGMIPREECYTFLFESVIEGNLVVRFPIFGGNFEIDARSHILSRILTTKEYEPKKREIIKTYANPKKDAIDVGANIGLFTVLLSSILSKENKVLALEPNPHALHLLHKNIARNGCSDKVTVFEGVAAKENGSATLNMIAGMPEYSCIESIAHPAMRAKSSQTQAVEGTSLDSLVARYKLKPGIIKIDVEGSEYLVLSGAMDTLKQYKPAVICEIRDDLLSSTEHNSKDIHSLLQDIGYKIFDIETMALPMKSPFIGDIVALPIEPESETTP